MGNINLPRASSSAIACKPFHTLQLSEVYSMLKCAHAQTWLCDPATWQISKYSRYGTLESSKESLEVLAKHERAHVDL